MYGVDLASFRRGDPRQNDILVDPVRSRRDREAFLKFPWRVYRDLPQWVPPIRSIQRRDLDPERGHFFSDGFGSKAELFLARRGREIVGRIAAIRNERHLAKHRDGVGFFGFFESIEDPAVAGALLAAAEAWLASQGLSVSRGPTSFTLNDPSGVTVEGFGVRPSVQIAYTPAWYAGLLTSNGYRKVRDLLAYQVSLETLDRILDLHAGAIAGLGPSGVAIREVRPGELEAEADLFANIFSASWERNWGAFPMVPGDLLRAAREMGPFFDPRLGAVVTRHGEGIGVFLAVLDPWEIFHGLNGRLGAKGLVRVLLGRKRIERLRVFILGMLPEHRNLPVLGPLILNHLRERRAHYPGLKTVEFSWILEDNVATRRLAESMGGEVRQRLRLFERRL